MRVVTTIKEVREQVKEWKMQGFSVGFVPTMGYLHEGHQSLIDAAVKQNGRVIVSIFVNPAQFGPTEDLECYPRDLDHDKKLCEEAGAGMIFHPSADTMYDRQASTTIANELLSNALCGKTRPAHFSGVCLVVSKLFHIIAPDRAYFGQKDAQQLVIIKRMVKDLNIDIEIIGCPIIREEDGLAKSSRNIYLSQEERKAATVLYRALQQAKKTLDAGETKAEKIRQQMVDMIQTEPRAVIDYVEVVDQERLMPLINIEEGALLAVAVSFGKARLIDNMMYS